MPFAAFRGGLLSRPELLSHFMHARSFLPTVYHWSLRVPGDLQPLGPTQEKNNFRMPLSSPQEGCQVQVRHDGDNDHSLSLFIVSLSRQKLSERFSQPEVCEHDQVKTRLWKAHSCISERTSYPLMRFSFLHDAALAEEGWSNCGQ